MELSLIPLEYREYYRARRINFIAGITNFPQAWDLYQRLDGIFMREFSDLEQNLDAALRLPLALYINADAKIRVGIELAFGDCMAESRSILRDAVEFVAHAHRLALHPELQEIWIKRDQDANAREKYDSEFWHYKEQKLFHGLGELFKLWKRWSELGSHANLAAMTNRLSSTSDGTRHSFSVRFTGSIDRDLWTKELFSMLLTCFTMEGTFYWDFDSRLKLDDGLRQMRDESQSRKETLRAQLISNFKIGPPGVVYKPKPSIVWP